jgi:hypothetical protein
MKHYFYLASVKRDGTKVYKCGCGAVKEVK